MNIKKELKADFEGVKELSRENIVSFTLQHENRLGFFVRDNRREWNSYLSAQTGENIKIKERYKYIGIVFDYEAFPDRQLSFTIEEVAKRLEKLGETAREIKKAIL